MAKTVRVRIAVVVNSGGDWGAAGVYDGDDLSATSFAGEMLETEPCDVAEHVVYVEADVPLPEAVTVQGDVEQC